MPLDALSTMPSHMAFTKAPGLPRGDQRGAAGEICQGEASGWRRQRWCVDPPVIDGPHLQHEDDRGW